MLLVVKHVLPRSIYHRKYVRFLVGARFKHVALVMLINENHANEEKTEG